MPEANSSEDINHEQALKEGAPSLHYLCQQFDINRIFYHEQQDTTLSIVLYSLVLLL